MFTWCLIGASSVAESTVLPAILRQPHTSVVSVVSGTPSRAEQLIRAAGLSADVAQLEQALADDRVDAVYISSVNRQHFPQAMAAIAAGKHVLCEKPIALQASEAAEMVHAAHAAGVVLATNHHMRNSVPHRLLAEAVSRGDLGQIVGASVRHTVALPRSAQGWRTEDAAAGSGVIYDITVHDADILRYVLGADPITVQARTRSGKMASDGIAESVTGTARFHNAVDVSFFQSFITGAAPSELAVHGTEASMIGTGIQSMKPVGTLTRWTGGKAVDIDLGEREDLFTCGVRHFQAAVDGKRPSPAATGVDGYWSVAFAEAAHKSASTGQEVEVTAPDPNMPSESGTLNIAKFHAIDTTAT